MHVCPHCDGWEHRNAPVAVYGHGEKAARFAILLRQWTDDLVLCTNGSPLSEEHAGLLHKAGIGVRQDAIARLEGKDGCLQAILFAGGETLARKALFFTTGQHPRSPLLEKLGCRFDEEGGVACDPDGRTSVPGVFVAGDVSATCNSPLLRPPRVREPPLPSTRASSTTPKELTLALAVRLPTMSDDQKTPWTFSDAARRASCVLGTPLAFALACATILVWGVTGPLFGYSDTWQLIINTGTTIVTFLMVFLVQNTQNRDARALHLKLDELLRSMKDARNRLINLENCTDEEIDQIERQFKALRRREERNKVNGTVRHGTAGA